MQKLIFNKLVRDGIIEKIENNNEYAVFEKLDQNTFEAALDKRLLEDLAKVLEITDKEQLTQELGELLEGILTKARLQGISYGDIEQARIQKLAKYGSFDNRIFLIQTVDQEYVDANKGCMTCQNGNCRVPYNEKQGYQDDGKLMGYDCVGYVSVYKKSK